MVLEVSAHLGIGCSASKLCGYMPVAAAMAHLAKGL